MDNRLNKPVIIAMVAVALILGVLLGVTTGIAKRIFGTDPKTIASASLQSMRAQNRLTVFAARYVSVVTSEQDRLGGLVSSQRTLILPGDVRYELDLSKLEHVDIVSGTKAWQFATRFAYAGIEVDQVMPELRPALQAFLALPKPSRGTKTMIVNYEQMMAIRKQLGFLDLEGGEK